MASAKPIIKVGLIHCMEAYSRFLLDEICAWAILRKLQNDRCKLPRWRLVTSNRSTLQMNTCCCAHASAKNAISYWWRPFCNQKGGYAPKHSALISLSHKKKRRHFQWLRRRRQRARITLFANDSSLNK